MMTNIEGIIEPNIKSCSYDSHLCNLLLYQKWQAILQLCLGIISLNELSMIGHYPTYYPLRL